MSALRTKNVLFESVGDAPRFGLSVEIPRAQVGDELVCEVSGLQIVMGFHGPLNWPRARVKGRPQLIVCGSLTRALRSERRESIAVQWGVHLRTVANWRRKLQLTGTVATAVHEIRSARLKIARMEHPDRFELPGLALLRTLSLEERRLLGRISAGVHAWEQAEMDELFSGTARDVSQRLKRSVGAVNSARRRYQTADQRVNRH